MDGIVRNSTGLVEFNSVPESVEALMTCNHLPVKSQGMKIIAECFFWWKSMVDSNSKALNNVLIEMVKKSF